jgi:hypothetical protein
VQGHRITVALADGVAEQRSGAIELRRVCELRQVEGHRRPLRTRRQAAGREIIDVGRSGSMVRHRKTLK